MHERRDALLLQRSPRLFVHPDPHRVRAGPGCAAAIGRLITECGSAAYGSAWRPWCSRLSLARSE
jgi:hypothetical protein